MNEPIHARLVKLSTLPGAIIDPLGGRGLGPIEPNYEVKGHYYTPPTIGERFVISRYESNVIQVGGFMTTSPVDAFERVGDSIIFRTLNSTYQLTPIYEQETSQS